MTPIIIDNTKLYSVDEISEMLKLSKNTLRIYLRKGRLKGIKLATKWYVSEESIKELLNIKPQQL